MHRRIIERALRERFVRKLRWTRRFRYLYGFTYHRIGDASSCPFDRGVYCCTRDEFRDHIRFLRRRFDLVGIDDIIRVQKSKRPPRRPMAVVTFDDGYIDNYTLAFPVLKELGAKAVFYPPTGYVASDVIPWWDEIAWTIRNATVPEIRLRESDRTYPLDPKTREQSIFRVLMLVKSRKTMPMKEQLDEIREACAPKGSVRDVKTRLFIDWNQLKEMSDAGMDIGSHTHSHEILSHLDHDAQRQELTQSKEILESFLNRPIESIAYPVGTRVAFDPATCGIARDVGYKLGFNFMAGTNPFPLADPFDIYRYEAVY